jgi:hypothetical protein
MQAVREQIGRRRNFALDGVVDEWMRLRAPERSSGLAKIHQRQIQKRQNELRIKGDESMDITQIDEDAIGWVVDFYNTESRGIHLSPEELKRFEAWLSDPKHAEAFVAARQRWEALDSLPGMREWVEKARKERSRQ